MCHIGDKTQRVTKRPVEVFGPKSAYERPTPVRHAWLWPLLTHLDSAPFAKSVVFIHATANCGMSGLPSFPVNNRTSSGPPTDVRRR